MGLAKLKTCSMCRDVRATADMVKVKIKMPRFLGSRLHYLCFSCSDAMVEFLTGEKYDPAS